MCELTVMMLVMMTVTKTTVQFGGGRMVFKFDRISLEAIDFVVVLY